MEEEKERIHPWELIGQFVYQYENIIKPQLDKGDVKTATGAIMDSWLRSSLLPSPLEANFPTEGKNPKAFVNYKFALGYLEGMVRDIGFNRELYLRVDRMISEIELMLRGNEKYEKFRERDKDRGGK